MTNTRVSFKDAFLCSWDGRPAVSYSPSQAVAILAPGEFWVPVDALDVSHTAKVISTGSTSKKSLRLSTGLLLSLRQTGMTRCIPIMICYQRIYEPKKNLISWLELRKSLWWQMQRKIPESKHSYIGERLENVCVVISGQRLSRRLSLKMCIARRIGPSFESLAYRPLLYGLSGGGGVPLHLT